jgi:hypothetical protein
MLDIILLVYLCWRIGNKAKQKGLKPGQWRLYTVLSWMGFELIGLIAGVMMFGYNQNDLNSLYGLMALAIACGFGGYLLVKSILDKKPDIMDDDISNLGS